MRQILLICLLFSALGICAQPAIGATDWYPKRVDGSVLNVAPYDSVGFVTSSFGKKQFSGSGAVAKDERLLYCCAHVVYENGRWADSVSFARSYNNISRPPALNYARGFRILEGYAANKYNDYFDYDFSVAYKGAAGSFGPALDIASDPENSLTTTDHEKMILGYPAYLDYDAGYDRYDPGYYYLHQTGPFNHAFEADTYDFGYTPYLFPYLVTEGVTTGPGNSGGPVLVEEGGDWKLAGILISGSYTGIGIYTLNSASEAAAADVLGLSLDGISRTASMRKAVKLKDASRKYRSVNFKFSGMPPETTKVVLHMSVTTANPAEMDAFLRSPSGRNYPVVLSGSGHIEMDLSGPFASGGSDTGLWTLFIRDALPGVAIALQSAGLTLTSRWKD
jgi:hypothetical protein